MKNSVLRRGAVLASVPLALALAALVLPDKRPDCKKAQEWVRTRAGRLPTTLSEIATFPVAYRQRIFDALPPGVKSALWHQHVDSVLRTESFSHEQQAFIRESIALLTPSSYQLPRHHRFPRERAMQLFPRTQLKGVFVHLGGRPAGSRRAGLASVQSLFIDMAGLLRSPVVHAGDCDCNDEDDWCSAHAQGTTCTKESDSPYAKCDPTGWGCGWFGLNACDGVCCDSSGGSCS